MGWLQDWIGSDPLVSVQNAYPHDGPTRAIHHGNYRTKPWYVPIHGNAHARLLLQLPDLARAFPACVERIEAAPASVTAALMVANGRAADFNASNNAFQRQ